MPRILFAYPEVSPLYVNGGIGTYVYEAAHLLAGCSGWEVDVLTDFSFVPAGMQPDFAKARALFGRAGIRLLDLQDGVGEPVNWGVPDLMRAERYGRHLVTLHQERRYDVIEFPDWRAPGFFAVRHKRTAGAFADTRLVAHLHSSTMDVAEWQEGHFASREEFVCHYMEEYVKTHADVVLSPTRYLLDPLRNRPRGPEKLMFRNGYPISPEAGHERNHRTARRREDTITVACVSRLERRKGQDVLAQAIKRLHDTQAVDAAVRFVFCGNDNVGLPGDRSMAASIQRILAGVPNWRILEAKSRQDLIEWLATEVDVCVVPSRGDNYPNVVLEAARAGCVLVCSDAGGIPELLQDYAIPAGVFPSGNAGELTQEVSKAIRWCRREPHLREPLVQQFAGACRRQSLRTIDTYQAIASAPRSDVTLPIATRRCESRVSIIVACDRDHWRTRETVESACASEYADYEVILAVTGQSEHTSHEWLAELEGGFPNLRVIHTDAEGVGAAWNAGLAAATGDLIVPLDVDHLMYPNLPRRCAQVLAARPELAYVTTYVQRHADDLHRDTGGPAPLPQPLGAVEVLTLVENTLGGGVAMVRRRDLERVGGFSQDLSYPVEWDLWLKMQERGMEGDVMPEVHAVCRRASERRRTNGVSSQVEHSPLRLLHHHESLLKEHALALSGLLMRGTPGDSGNPSRRLDEVLRTVIKAMRLVAQHPAWAMRYAGQRLSRAMGAHEVAPAVRIGRGGDLP